MSTLGPYRQSLPGLGGERQLRQLVDHPLEIGIPEVGLGVSSVDVEAGRMAHQLPHRHRPGLRHLAVRRRHLEAPFYKLRPLQILVTLILELMLAIVVLGLIVSGPLATAIGNAVGIGDTALTVFNIAKWPVLLVIVSLMLAVLYYSAPNAKLPGFKWISPGSVLAVVRLDRSPRRRSRSTWRTSAPTARPTGRSAAGVVPGLDVDHEPRRCCSGPS